MLITLASVLVFKADSLPLLPGSPAQLASYLNANRLYKYKRVAACAILRESFYAYKLIIACPLTVAGDGLLYLYDTRHRDANAQFWNFCTRTNDKCVALDN